MRISSSLLAATIAASMLLSVPVSADDAKSPGFQPAPPASPPDQPPGAGPLIPKPSAPDPKPFTLEDRYFDAARRGDLDMLKICIGKGIDPKIKDEVGRSALDLAVRDARDLEMAEYLHDKGAAIDEPDAVGRTPLHEAAGAGEAAIARWLLKEGAKVDRKDMQGRTPLHNAIMGGSREITVMFLDAGADPNVRDNFQDTPLIQACNKGIDEIAKVLVEKGADPLLKDQEGRTAAQRADDTAIYCKSLPGNGPIPKPADAPREDGEPAFPLDEPKPK